jgi:hypothetical protein
VGCRGDLNDYIPGQEKGDRVAALMVFPAVGSAVYSGYFFRRYFCRLVGQKGRGAGCRVVVRLPSIDISRL